MLRPPVEPMLAHAAEAVPGPAAVRAGVAYEQKLDGHRALLFTASGPGGAVVVQTRRGALVQDRWPDLVAAAEAQLPQGLVLDGELVVWDIEAGRLSFEALQRRAATRARGAAVLASRWPSYFVAFDLLQHDGQELLTLPYVERRALLENLFSEHALSAPWTLVPQTTDLATAREWLESWTDVSGVEGILVKPLNGRYLPGYRGWTKIRRRDTTEMIVGAITGTLTRPGLLVLGRHDHDGRLRPVGRTVPLRPDAARQVAEHLTAAAPGHPWTGAKFSAAWGSRDVLDTTLVNPTVVAEVSADRAIDHGGIYRHPLRFQRLRLDTTLDDVPEFGHGAAATG
ncbi:ATP-dependent DNA ligase [Streptomyces spororaveus]|uniref:DNA ligase C2 n=1 Tax=Streptomyces spororaveus TaxID=284039 RepID=A0ABQ3TQD9_9ACTN|nr:ATP-dependent DNA ligase [Streptomyces spororaveus]GHI82625.1 DNA ligase C2 [Streptomyces spororaveus]